MKKDRPYRKSTIPDNARCVFEGVIFDVYQWEQVLYDGTFATFEKAVRPDTVVIFPVLEDGRILLIDDEQPGRGSLLGAPAGRLEAGETPEECAARELKEETGLVAKEIILFSEVHPVMKLDWCVYTFIARGCTKVSDPHLDAGEKIKEHPVSFEELIALPYDERNLDGSIFRQRALEARLDAEKMAELRNAFFG
ncbi:MAG: NUDIX hydrolase [Patescibacteria group bacterium]